MSILTDDINALQFVLWEAPANSNSGRVSNINWTTIIGKLYTNSKLIDPIRAEFLKNGKSIYYKELKKCLPSFMPQVTRSSGRKLKEVDKLSCFVYFDVDFYPVEPSNSPPSFYVALAEKAKELLKYDKFVYSCWYSISKSGLGIIIKIPSLTFENFNYNWNQARLYLVEKYNLPIDRKVHNINRLCFISYDSEPYIYDEALPFNPDLNDKVCTVKKEDSITIQPDKPPIFTPKPIAEPNLQKYAHLNGIEFFKESKIDIHFPELLKLNKVDGINVRFDGVSHYWFAKKMPVVRLVLGRRTKLKFGERYKNLLKQLVNFVWLNSHWSREDTLNWILHYNKTWCSVPLSYNEIYNLFKHVYDELRPAGKLSPCIVYKHNHFTANANLSKKQKLSRSGKAKSNKTELKLANALKVCLNTLTIANNSNLAKIANVSRQTTIKVACKLNVNGVNNYVRTTKQESDEFFGILIEFLPNFEKLIYDIPRK